MWCETGCEVECAGEVGGILGAGEEGNGDAATSGWNGGVCGGGLGEHDGRFEFILWSTRRSECERSDDGGDERSRKDLSSYVEDGTFAGVEEGTVCRRM